MPSESADEPASKPAKSAADSSSDETRVEPSGVSGTPTLRAAASPRPVAAGAQTFLPDTIVSGRYRVIRFIALGAMGEVYEVEDQALHGHLALKTVRSEIASDEKALDRFKREIHLARKVTHPNICRIFDLGFHRLASAEGREPVEIMLLTMELLPGQTLSQHIAKGRMTPSVARPIVEQMCAGLDAAHAAGIIHRDFKSANVVLVPDPRKGMRAVITDFGLARGLDVGTSGASISDTGVVVGTPAYMAPEQVQGLDLTPAADVYALGIVMYEMLTGVRPFDGGSAITVAVRRLTHPPPPLAQYLAEVDPGWETVIRRCLERDPEARYANVMDVVDALAGRSVRPSSSSTLPAMDLGTESILVPGEMPGAASATDRVGATARAAATVTMQARRPMAAYVAGGATALLVLAGVVYAVKSRSAQPASTSSAATPAPVVARRAVAVLDFKNVSGRGDAAWLSTAVAEMLTTELAAGDDLRTISGQEVARVKRDLGLAGSDSLAKEDAARFGQNLGADLIGIGSYTVLGESDGRLLRIDFRLQDAATGAMVATSSATGTEAQLFDLVSRAGRDVRLKLGLRNVSPAEALAVEASLPRDPEAARFYAEGLARLRVADALGAREVLEKAVAADPKHPLPHSALAAAWSLLGYSKQALAEARTAAAYSEKLPAPEKLFIEARAHELGQDWDRALEGYASLFTSHPDDVEYGLRLTDAQTSAGRAKGALVTLEALRKLPAPLAADPRIDLAQARAFQELGEYRQQQALAATAYKKAGALRASVLMAAARLLESTALDGLGERERAQAAAEEARQLYEKAGDPRGVARALEGMGNALYRHGEFEGAQRLYERALVTHRETGDQASEARSLANLGYALMGQGQTPAAQKNFDAALATFRRTGAKYEAAATLNGLGFRFQLRGDLDLAQKRYREALVLFGEIGDKPHTAVALTNLGEVLYARGQLKEAEDLHQESLAINREIGEKQGAAYDTYRLGFVFAARGDLRLAEERYAEALKGQKELDDQAWADTQLAMASLRLAQGRHEEAENLARECEEFFRGRGAADSAALANLTVADALRARARGADAMEALTRAEAGAAKSESKAVRLAITIGGARVRASAGKPVAPELKALTAAALEAHRAGYAELALEARLAAGELEVAHGEQAKGRLRLEAVKRDATRTGHGQIARRAEGKTTP